MSVMQFIPELTRYLKCQRVIYTVRKYYYTSSIAYVSSVGSCRRTYLVELDEASLDNLRPYVYCSGFPDLESWLSMIRKFIPSSEPKYLYRVEVL